jgi:N-acyl-D-amino-acid deacylase
MLSLEDAVRIAFRGVLRPGMKADVVVFNPATIIDHATFERSHQSAEGVAAVIVNGKVTLIDGKMTGDRAGVALRLR